jgi:hypothetical protein
MIGSMVAWLVRCDNCEDEEGPGSDPYSDTYNNKSELKRAFRDRGWTFGKQDLCPECSNKTKGDKKR